MEGGNSLTDPRILVVGDVRPEEDYQLPSLETVRREVAAATKLRETGIPAGSVTADDMVVFNQLSPAAREAIAYNSMFLDLFNYIFYIRCNDLPVDLYPTAIWVLKMLMCPWEDCTWHQLNAISFIAFPENFFESMRLSMRTNFWWKMAYYLLHSSIDKPAEAVPHLRNFVEMVESKIARAWTHYPDLYSLYGEALARDGSDNKKARKVLELFLEAPTASCAPEFLIRTRVYLARVLRRIGQEDKALPHEAFVVRYFRTNNHGRDVDYLRRLLMPDENNVEPLLHALGGEKWLTSYKVTARTFHNISRSCSSCDARQLQKKLARCSKCQDAYYCSTKCQQADWPAHKGKCKIMCSTLKTIEVLKRTNPKAAESLARWKVWRTEAYYNEALIHALGVHQDQNRGRTHILVLFIEYTPKASNDLQFKFKVLYCQVLKVSDILANMETIFGPEKNDITKDVEYTLDLFSDKSVKIKPHKVPLMCLKMGKGLEPWLSLTFVTMDSLRMLPYNPDWRSLFNKGEKPGDLKIAGLKLTDCELDS